MGTKLSIQAALDLARDEFRRDAAGHLTPAEVELFDRSGAWTAMPPDAGAWAPVVGFAPDPDRYREVNFLAADAERGGTVVLASALVGGGAAGPRVYIEWRPGRYRVEHPRRPYTDQFLGDYLAGNGEIPLDAYLLIGEPGKDLAALWLPGIGLRLLVIEIDDLARACKGFLARRGARRFADTQAASEAAGAERWPGWERFAATGPGYSAEPAAAPDRSGG